MIDQLGKFQTRTRIFFGRGAVAALGEIAKQMGATRFLLVADAGLKQYGGLDKALESLTQAGLTGKEFTDVEPEPYLDGAAHAAALGREIAAALVVGWGGGAAMDTQGRAFFITNEGKAQQYVGLNLVPRPGVPTLMVPTTSGTGAEVTFTAVFTNRETKAKGGINSDHMFPEAALLDPELTISLPPDVTATTGMDALTHAIESVTSRSSTVFTEALALTSIRLISENLRRAVFRGDDIEARENMLMGSLLGGMALANAGVGACHALAYPLGGMFRVPHGLANAILVSHVMGFNLPAAERYFALIAGAIGESVTGISLSAAGAKAVEAARHCAVTRYPSSLSEIGIPRSDISTLVQGALKVTRPVENNPRTLGTDEAETIYQLAFG